MESETNDQIQSEEKTKRDPFKKPTLLIGKIGRLPRKIQAVSLIIENENLPVLSNNSTSITEKPDNEEQIDSNISTSDSVEVEEEKPAAHQNIDNSITLPYKPPVWSGLPETNGKRYSFEVLKNGAIINNIDLMTKPYWVFGRLPNCDIYMQHPTISRYHAVLQFRPNATQTESPGFYIFDLGSTHGTFLNGKNKLKPKLFVPVRVGHMIRLGCSQRSYILNGPEDDEEEESELTVTELKQLKAQKIAEKAEKLRKEELEREERKRKEAERGVDWGLGDDANEDEDLSENPYAQTNNEELYLDDPKKALRGFFEREGQDLEYDCSEQGMGQFLCKVALPLDDEMGKPIVAEVLHRGKKKEAVEQCALEACRILDRFGVLRQATHESRKRKARNWEENDFYDSDDDIYLDRTGTIEKKREKRMKAKDPEKAETYESLLLKETAITASINDIERRLGHIEQKHKQESSRDDEDSLDSYMKGLQEEKLDKHVISKLKLELVKLKKDLAQIKRLINIAKPAHLPLLLPQSSTNPQSTGNKLPHIGKRKGGSIKFPQKPILEPTNPVIENAIVECESDSEEEDSQHNLNQEKVEEIKDHLDEEKDSKQTGTEPTDLEGQGSSSGTASGLVENENSVNEFEFLPKEFFHESLVFEKFERIVKTGLPPSADKYKEPLEKILVKLHRLASNEDRLQTDWRILSAKRRKVMKLISDLRQSMDDQTLKHKVSMELKRIMCELDSMTEEKFKVVKKVRKMGDVLKNISVEISKDITEMSKSLEKDEPVSFDDPTPGTSADVTESDSPKNKDKSKRKEEKRKREEEAKKQKGYEEDSKKDDYCMWVPPKDQSGDGRTSLNEKLGY